MNNTEHKPLVKTMTIGLTEDGECGVRVSPDIDAAVALQMVGTLALHLLNVFNTVAENIIKTNEQDLTPKELDAATLGIKESLYDAADSVFSNVLTQFYPEAPKNSIEDEAILELTNKKIEERYNALPKKEREQFKRKYQVMKLKMQLTPKKETNVNEGNTDTNSETSETA